MKDTMIVSDTMIDRTAFDDITLRLRIRASIRRSICTRKSVQEGKPDRIADLLEEAATAIEYLLEEREDRYND
jgi:hypothetical protein